MSELANTIANARPSEHQGPPTVAHLLEVQKREIARALPATMTAERFSRVVLTEVKRTPKLRQCTAESLLGAVMLAAQLGLEPGPMQLSYLVPRKSNGVDQVTFQIGYRGMIDLATRSGRVLDVTAHEVKEADAFEYRYGLEPMLNHTPARGDRGATIYAYSVARFPNGGNAFVVLDTDEIAARRERSSTPNAGPWKTDFDAMARKTAVRALEPFLPRSVEFAQASRFDGAVITDYTAPDLVDDVLDVEAEEAEEAAGAEPDPSPSPGGDGSAPDGPAPPESLVVLAAAGVERYRKTKKAGAASANRELDAYLNDLELGMDLEGLDSARAELLLAWIGEHRIGAA